MFRTDEATRPGRMTAKGEKAVAARTKRPNGGAAAATSRPAAPPPFDPAAWARDMVAGAADRFDDAELAVLRGQLDGLAAGPRAASPAAADPTAPTLVRDTAALRAAAAQLREADAVALDLETSGLDPFSGEVVGVGLAAGSMNYYVPTAHRFEGGRLRPDQLPLDLVAREVRFAELPLVAHNAKFEFRWLRRHAGVVGQFIWDTMLAARLLQSHLPADLEAVAVRELDVPAWSLPQAEMEIIQRLAVDRVARYCAKDVRYTLEIYRRQLACRA